MADNEKAWHFANECRKFEIENFWKRATYYWAYITGSIVAYAFVLQHSFANDRAVTLGALLALPFFNKIVLCIFSFIAFLFCLAWVFVNKGSKYWQTTWEVHTADLENPVVGDLYKTRLDADVFNPCPFSLTGYRYSVTKITMFCSLVLAILTGALVLFHFSLFVPSFIQFFRKDCEKIILVFFLFVAEIIVTGCLAKRKDKINKAKHYEWEHVKSIL